MTHLRIATGLLFCAYLSSIESGRANAVVEWNAIAIQTITATPVHPGATTFLDSAMVQAAVYDAVVAIDGRFQPYYVVIPGATGSPAAATAKAAHDILVNRFPGQTASVDKAYHEYLAKNGLSESDPGVEVGQKAAAGIIALRANDGSFPNPPPPPFVGGTEPGEWRPTESYLPPPPPSFAPMLVPWLADVTPFTLTSPSQFRAGPPPALTSRKYTRAYNEVKDLGEFSRSTRTPDQTDLAYFWAANYTVVWNHALREIASAQALDIDESARLLALANLAMADAGITAWDTKRHYVFWRPVTAIQQGDSDGNRRTEGDPSWHPLINTPNYPDYTSGANNVTGAVTRILALFFDTDEMTFSVTTTNSLARQQTRTYSRFSDAAEDVVNARIYEGIHFRFADTTARRQGREVANWAFTHFLRPLHDEPNDNDDDHNDDR
jgi:hypothetical protein